MYTFILIWAPVPPPGSGVFSNWKNKKNPRGGPGTPRSGSGPDLGAYFYSGLPQES